MEWAKELLRILVVLFTTVLLVALLRQVPWFLAFTLLVPLAIALWFWPHSSTVLAYVVTAVFGTVLSGWSILRTVEQPSTMYLSFLWLPLVWGPAGVIVKRLEVLVVQMWKKDEKYTLPKF